MFMSTLYGPDSVLYDNASVLWVIYRKKNAAYGQP